MGPSSAFLPILSQHRNLLVRCLSIITTRPPATMRFLGQFLVIELPVGLPLREMGQCVMAHVPSRTMWLVDDDGQQFGANCARLKRPGGSWSFDHGTSAYDVRVNGSSSGKAGFATKIKAHAASTASRSVGSSTAIASLVAQFLDSGSTRRRRSRTRSPSTAVTSTPSPPTFGAWSFRRYARLTSPRCSITRADLCAEMRALLRGALTDAMRQELVSVNAAALTRDPGPSRRRSPLCGRRHVRRR